jgi:hypothetical protein
MTDEEEFAARSQLEWTREGDGWILLYRRRRMGRVVADKDHSGMWRSVKPNGLSDMANLSRSKDGVMAQAIREVAWDAANIPLKCPVKRPKSNGLCSSPRARGCFRMTGLSSDQELLGAIIPSATRPAFIL